MFNDRADQARKILAHLRHLGWQPTRVNQWTVTAWPDGPGISVELISAECYGPAGPLGRDVVPMASACADVCTLLRGQAQEVAA
jgi:hypothetical protein